MSYQPERSREPNPDAEDEAHDAAVQRDIDDARDALHAAERTPHKPQPCHNCEQPHSAIRCPFCGEERPAYTALVKMSRAA